MAAGWGCASGSGTCGLQAPGALGGEGRWDWEKQAALGKSPRDFTVVGAFSFGPTCLFMFILLLLVGWLVCSRNTWILKRARCCCRH